MPPVVPLIIAGGIVALVLSTRRSASNTTLPPPAVPVPAATMIQAGTAPVVKQIGRPSRAGLLLRWNVALEGLRRDPNAFDPSHGALADQLDRIGLPTEAVQLRAASAAAARARGVQLVASARPIVDAAGVRSLNVDERIRLDAIVRGLRAVGRVYDADQLQGVVTANIARFGQ